MKLLYFHLKSIALLTLMFLDAIYLGMDWERLLVAITSSIAGAFTLTFYRKSLNLSEKVIKILSASLGGFFIGAAVAEYLGLQKLNYMGAAFYLTSFLILVFLRALLSVTERNATGIVATIYNKINVKNSTIVTPPIDNENEL